MVLGNVFDTINNMILTEIFARAAQENWSTGHFNASELDHMRAIIEACKEAGAPAIIGMSEGERTHLGLAEAVAIRDVMRKEYGIPIFLNADHTKHVDAAKAAIDAGCDSVHIDLSALAFEENIKGTADVVEYARSHESRIKNKELRINIEGELGYLKGESKIQNEKIEVNAEDYTKPEEAVDFVRRTRVDRLAIVVGNIHGISLDEPTLDIARIRAIREAVPFEITLVLHAASGVPDDQIRAAISAGISNIHINTDIRVAYVNELKKSLEAHVDEAAMYKLDAKAARAMKEVIKEKLKLFGSWNRI